MGDSSVWDVITDHWRDFFSFVLSFVVISSLWSVHTRALWELLDDYNGVLFVLSTFWLLAIVFLPVPTALLNTGSGLSATGTRLYLAAVVSAIMMTARPGGCCVIRSCGNVHATHDVMRAWTGVSAPATFMQALALGVSFLSPAWELVDVVAVGGDRSHPVTPAIPWRARAKPRGASCGQPSSPVRTGG